MNDNISLRFSPGAADYDSDDNYVSVTVDYCFGLPILLMYQIRVGYDSAWHFSSLLQFY